ncbi:AHH domain-containing protein [Candidatus Bandiella numerosa]|uniref:AHH domain-containing protein n=1 Tax=Candidatus Bandiella numerosa TaxID=2570586 RepID=UPI00249EB734|nr:AHH domain-containing protein [Candidatus Bandiella numerosa]WHA04525.1 AHH domain-containing protein [Candidatus Bandiella numerosa]
MHRESCQENIVKHVYDSDEGYTLGTSIDYITGNKGSDGKIRLAEDNYILSRSDEAKYSNTYMSEERRTQDLISKSYKYGVVFGGRDGDGYTFATIGKGEVRCTESGIGKVCEIEKANRDVSKTSSFDYDYKIETIRAKFSVLDEETKKKAIENLKSGKFFENIATSFMSAIGEVEKVINDLLPKEKIKEIDEEFKKKEVNKEHEDKKSSKEIKGKKNTAKKSDNIQDGGKQDNRQDDPSQGDNGKLNEEKASTDNKKLNPVQAMEKRIDSLDISSNEKTEAKYLLRKSLEEINMMSEAGQNKLAEEIKNQDKFSILDIFIPKAEAVVPAAIGACLINPWCAALLLGGAAVISSKLQDAIKNKPSYQVGINLFEKSIGSQFDLKKPITQVGLGQKMLIASNSQAVIIDDANYQQLKQNNQIIKEKGIEYIVNPSIMVDETGKEHVISTPIPEKIPPIPGTPINNNNKPTIETYPEADKQEPLPGFTPVAPEATIEVFPINDIDQVIIYKYEIDGKKFQDHHIISDKNEATKEVMKLFEKAGINPQSRDNKIFLPTEPEHHATRSIHKGRHWDDVSGELARKMDTYLKSGQEENWNQAQYKQTLESILKEERSNLKSGNRALNKNMREWSDDKGRK